MINNELKEWHMKNLKCECSRLLYDRLCAACEGREGGLIACDQDLIYDACVAEDVKEQLRADIRGRGVVVGIYNGGQSYSKENKSVTQLRAYTDAQRKILSELKITPAKRGAAAAGGEDAFDAM